MIRSSNLGHQVYSLICALSRGLTGDERPSYLAADFRPGLFTGDDFNLMVCPAQDKDKGLFDIVRGSSLVIEVPLSAADQRDNSQCATLLRGLDEPLVHYLHGYAGPVPPVALGRRHLGITLAAYLDRFVGMHPDGVDGMNVGPTEEGYRIDGRNGLYEVMTLGNMRWGDKTHPTASVLRDLSFDQIRELIAA